MQVFSNPKTFKRLKAGMVLLCGVLALPLLSSSVFAHSVVFQYFTCRVCGHTFIDAVSVSGSSFGIRLDFQKTGMLPQPWPVQKCPQCSFIMSYDTKKPGGGTYTADEFDDLRRYVFSDEYQSSLSETPDYGYVIKIAEHVGGVSDFDMAGLYRAAFWQSEYPRSDRSRHPLMDGYLSKMLEYYEKCARPDNPCFEEKLVSYYMQVEVNRRLGRFAAAEECRQTVLRLLDAIESDGLDEDANRLFENVKLFTEQQEQHITNEDGQAKSAVFPEREQPSEPGE